MSEITVALISGGTVVNMIICSDISFARGLGYDKVVDVTNASPMPGIGWSESGGVFSAPPPAPTPSPTPSP